VDRYLYAKADGSKLLLNILPAVAEITLRAYESVCQKLSGTSDIDNFVNNQKKRPNIL
jgi:hypothetical protein